MNNGPGQFAKRGFISRLPMWFKAGFIRFWFAGAVFFFVGWGLAVQSADQLDLVLVLGLIHGVATDILVNRIIAFLSPEESGAGKYMLFFKKNFISVPVNLVFGIVFAAAVAYTYHIINLTALNSSGLPEGSVTFGAEPLGYGFIYFIFESILILIKNGFVKIFQDAKKNIKG